MGKRARSRVSLADALFTTARKRVLAILFGRPQQAFHAADIIRQAACGSGAVQRELKKLAETGLVSVTVSGNRKLYQANRSSPLFSELHGLIVKTVGLVEPLHEALAPLAETIHAAFVYGSVAGERDTAASDIDLMVLARTLGYADVFRALQTAERKLGRPISPNIMTPEEWRRKSAQAGSFAARVARQPMLFVIGDRAALDARE